MEKFTNAVIVKITKHSNFIVGQKEGEVVAIPVDSELKEYGEAVLHKNLGHKIGDAVQIFLLKLMFVNIIDLIFYRE